MASKPKNSEAERLEQYRIALENTGSQSEIATVMADLGFNEDVIAEGKAILAKTRAAYDLNSTEDDETSAAYGDFSAKKTQLEDTFDIHRKKAKVVFRKDPLTAEKLSISGAMQHTYIKWIESVKKFYNVIKVDTAIKNKLARLKVTEEELTAANAKITALEAARAEYLKEKGESQSATKTKGNAFEKIDDWMEEFYAVAKIGLEDHPQLQEALGKIIKS